MKANHIFYAAVLGILALGTSALPLGAVELPWEGRTPFKTAIIRYKLTGPSTGKQSGKGESTVYVRDYGRERVRISQYSLKGEEGGWLPMNSTTIITKKEVIDVRTQPDDDGKPLTIGKKWTNPVKYYRESYQTLKGENLENYHKSLKENAALMDFMGTVFNAEQAKAKKVLGYDTDLLNMMGNKIYYISGSPIPLKGDTFMMNFQATKIDVNARIPERVFQPPAGVKINYDPKKDEDNRGYAQLNVEKLGSMMTSTKGLEKLLGVRKSKREERKGSETKERAVTNENQPPKKEKKKDKEEGSLEDSMKKGLKSLKSLFN